MRCSPFLWHGDWMREMPFPAEISPVQFLSLDFGVPLRILYAL